jgi:hypothetical protein
MASDTYGVWIYSIEYGCYRALDEEGPPARWLADGNTLLRRRGDKFLAVDPTSGDETEVYQIPEGQTVNAWELTRDNDWIYFLDERIEADIWMLEYPDL